MHTRNVLAWLYNFEEWYKKQNPGFYIHRAASTNGQAEGGIIWFRGLL